MKKKPFMLPQAYLNQLEEFSKGYYIVVVDENNNFQTYAHYPDTLTEMGMLNYLELQAGAMQSAMRQQAEAEVELDDSGDEEEAEQA